MMPGWVYIVAAAVVLLPPALIAVVTYYSVLALGKARAIAVGRRAAPLQHAKVRQYDEWAKEEGFEWVGGYLIEAGSRIFIGAWQHAEKSVYFCVYCHAMGEAFDLVTYFSEGVTLTTGSTKDSQLLPPPPGEFMQAFPGKTHAELWEKHLLAEAFLASKLNVSPTPEHMPFDQVFTEAAHRQVDHVRSIPLWPVRAVYWFLVRRSRMSGRSIQDQHEAGCIEISR